MLLTQFWSFRINLGSVRGSTATERGVDNTSLLDAVLDQHVESITELRMDSLVSGGKFKFYQLKEMVYPV